VIETWAKEIIIEIEESPEEDYNKIKEDQGYNKTDQGLFLPAARMWKSVYLLGRPIVSFVVFFLEKLSVRFTRKTLSPP